MAPAADWGIRSPLWFSKVSQIWAAGSVAISLLRGRGISNPCDITSPGIRTLATHLYPANSWWVGVELHWATDLAPWVTHLSLRPSFWHHENHKISHKQSQALKYWFYMPFRFYFDPVSILLRSHFDSIPILFRFYSDSIPIPRIPISILFQCQSYSRNLYFDYILILFRFYFYDPGSTPNQNRNSYFDSFSIPPVWKSLYVTGLFNSGTMRTIN